MKNWSVHFCPFDRHCRQFGAPWRIHVGMPWGHLVIALRWRDRVQLWLPWKTRRPNGEKYNYTLWWSPISFEPRRQSKEAQ